MKLRLYQRPVDSFFATEDLRDIPWPARLLIEADYPGYAPVEYRAGAERYDFVGPTELTTRNRCEGIFLELNGFVLPFPFLDSGGIICPVSVMPGATLCADIPKNFDAIASEFSLTVTCKVILDKTAANASYQDDNDDLRPLVVMARAE